MVQLEMAIFRQYWTWDEKLKATCQITVNNEKYSINLQL